jgi:hypothetical protein
MDLDDVWCAVVRLQRGISESMATPSRLYDCMRSGLRYEACHTSLLGRTDPAKQMGETDSVSGCCISFGTLLMKGRLQKR